MRYNLLYITAPTQMQQVKQALQRMEARVVANGTAHSSRFELGHRLLGNVVLEITLLSEIDGVSAHLRQNPADLLIYDERGDAQPATDAIKQIRKDVKALADLWGPDFFFPMSRVVAILEEEERQTERAFELGRLNVRDVCVAPKSISILILWLKRVLTQGVIRKNRVGVALSGGGLEGFLYQVGCLYALEEALSRGSLSDAHVISGVSSGAIAGTMFAAKLPFKEIVNSIYGDSELLPPLTSSTIFDIAGFDIAKRVTKETLSWTGLSPQKWLEKTMRTIPTGFFKGENLEAFFKEALNRVGMRDRFEDFKTQLFIGATDQDSFEHVIFGEAPWDKVHVSEAVRASMALPPMFMPKHINGRWFIDGQVTKTTDLELVVDKGCSLVVIVNPLKPYTSNVPGTSDQKGGIYGLIQTVKALVATRLHASLSHLTERYPDVDFLVFEPDEECANAMAGSPMRYKIRPEIIQLAYECTLRKLRERHAIYSVKLSKYGYKLKTVEELRTLEKTKVIRD